MWPDDRDLPVEVEAAFGADLTADPGAWSWTDLSSRLPNIPITTRVPAAQFSPGTCSVTLINDDAALTPLHPMSPYWPNVELGTPLRVRLRRAEDAFARTVSGGWGAADSGQVWTTGGTAAGDFSVSTGVARHSHPTVNNVRRTTLATALANSEQVVDVATSALLTGAALVTGLLFRYQDPSNYYWLRCEFNSGGTTVMLKLSKCVGGTFTDIASLNPVPGVPYAANTYLRVRAGVVGGRLSMKVWNPAGAEPAGWQLTATDTAITAAGATGLQSWLVLGNTNALPVTALHKSYAVRVDRFSGFADQWEPTFAPITTGESASAVRVTCSGILRRLTQGTQPTRSPLRRTIGASNPVAYHPAEDGVAATAAGSAVAGQGMLTVTGVVEFKPIDDYTFNTTTVRYGTSALADLSAGGSLATTFGADAVAATQSAWTVHVIGQFEIGSASGDVVLMEWTTPGGTHTRWRFVEIKATLHTQVIAYTPDGAATVVVDRTGVLGGFRTWVVSAEQVGGNINVTYDMGGGVVLTGSVAGTLGGVASMSVNPTGATSTQTMPFGHLAVWGTPQVPYQTDAVADLYGVGVHAATRSYQFEAAHLRLARLAAEDGVPLDMPEVLEESVQRMGWQPTGERMDLYRECVEVDLGILYELGFGLGYRAREYRYNKPVDMTVDLATYTVTDGSSSDVLRPVYDDERIRNQLTVERRDGSSVVVVDEDSQQRSGVYGDSVELNLAGDEQLLDQAGWRLHLGSVVGLRESTFPIDLAANPDLVDGWLSCGAGSRLVRTNPPAQYGPEPLDRLVEGWTETIAPRSWLVQVTPSPAESWDVATVDGPQRVTAGGSTLAAAVTATATTLSLATTSAVSRWTTDPADFPLDLNVNGEQVTVSAISGAGSPQTATVAARSVNGVVKAHAVGAPVDVWQPAVLAL